MKEFFTHVFQTFTLTYCIGLVIGAIIMHQIISYFKWKKAHKPTHRVVYEVNVTNYNEFEQRDERTPMYDEEKLFANNKEHALRILKRKYPEADSINIITFEKL